MSKFSRGAELFKEAISGTTQAAVATALGVAQAQVSSWTTGRLVPGAAAIAKIESMYGVESYRWAAPARGEAPTPRVRRPKTQAPLARDESGAEREPYDGPRAPEPVYTDEAREEARGEADAAPSSPATPAWYASKATPADPPWIAQHAPPAPAHDGSAWRYVASVAMDVESLATQLKDALSTLTDALRDARAK